MSALYTIHDVIDVQFFKLPKALFITPKYKALSSDAKLTYALLYDRLSLSLRNSWVNAAGEVYLIYTREDIAEELGVSYKKAIVAFKALTGAGLILETRGNNAAPKRIYIVRPDVSKEETLDYAANEGAADNNGATCRNGSPTSGDVTKTQTAGSCSGSSRTAVSAYGEVPKQHINKTDKNKTDYSKTEKSQSVTWRFPDSPERGCFDGQTDGGLQAILENCELKYFDAETRITFQDAIERLWYCERFRIGSAVLPQANVRSRMWNLDYTRLTSALHNLRQNKDRPVKNITAYVMSTIFNCIAEEYSLLLVDPYLNRLRSGEGERCCT